MGQNITKNCTKEMSFALDLLTICIISCISTVFGNDAHFTCGDWMSSNEKNSLSDGVYNITSIIDRSDFEDSWREVYCAFDYTRNYAWTLIESGSRSVMSNTLRTVTFVSDSPYNEDNVESYRNSLYRLSRDWMYSLYFVSDYLFSTCEFDTSFSKDWLLFRLSELNINPFFEEFSSTCVNSVSANIRGYSCQNSTVQIWTIGGTYHMVTDSSLTSCGCNTWAAGAVSGEHNFGFYNLYNTEFTCTATISSTTNWWFGSDVTEYKIPTESPTAIPASVPSAGPTDLPSVNPSQTPSQSPIDMVTSRSTFSPSHYPTGSAQITTTLLPTIEESIEETEDGTGTIERDNGNNNGDGISNQFIIIIAVIAGFFVLCCVFCLLFLGVISYHMRKHNESKMQVIHGGNKSLQMNTRVAANARDHEHVDNVNGVHEIRLTNVASMSSTAKANSDPNAQEQDGPNITWQELAQLQSLTTKAVNAIKQPKVAPSQMQPVEKMTSSNENVVFINNNNDNQSQVKVGEEELVLGDNNDQVHVARKLPLQDGDNSRENKNVLTEGGVE